jgi:hypothetical protein
MTGTALVSIAERWAEEAAKAVAEEPIAGGLWLSTQGGILALDDEELPGNQAYVIILDSVRENTYYPNKFDPTVKAPPVCYAFGRGADAEEMGPHSSMQADAEYFQPQHDTCLGCPMNEWGTADTGKGKACQNRRRLTLIPAGVATPIKGSRDFEVELFEDPKHFQTADVAFLKLPVTSTKQYARYITQLSASVRRPPHGVLTRIYLEPHANDQYHICFEMVEEVPDALAQIVMDRHDAEVAREFQGYKPPTEAEQPVSGSLKGLRRR